MSQKNGMVSGDGLSEEGIPEGREAHGALGVVYLIGAGPGDPEFLTIAAQRILGLGDVILYDGLVNPQIMRWAPSNAEQICVGKRGHGGVWKQSQIDDLMVTYAKRGLRVVRLKGGDSAIFARSSEEIERLESEGIAYHLVPGVTTASAIHAYCGIPLTHRDWSSSVALVSGQLQLNDGNMDQEDQVDWQAYAKFPGTLVLYMAINSAGSWSSELIRGGKSPRTPVALVRRCSMPDQEVLECELSQVPDVLQMHPSFRPPVLVVIGEVVQARHRKASRGSGVDEGIVLRGEQVLVTSPSESGVHRLAERFRTFGAEVYESPAIEIQKIATVDEGCDKESLLGRLENIDWIVFSSRHGVRFLMERIFTNGGDSRWFARAKIAAVGGSTAESLQSYGLRADFVPSAGAGGEMLLEEWMPQVHGKRVLLIKNPDGKRILEESLRGVCSELELMDVYRQVPVMDWPASVRELVRESGAARGHLWVTATSSNLAKESFRLLGADASRVRWVAISNSVAQTLKELGASEVVVAQTASYDGVCAAVADEVLRKSDRSIGRV